MLRYTRFEMSKSFTRAFMFGALTLFSISLANPIQMAHAATKSHPFLRAYELGAPGSLRSNVDLLKKLNPSRAKLNQSEAERERVLQKLSSSAVNTVMVMTGKGEWNPHQIQDVIEALDLVVTVPRGGRIDPSLALQARVTASLMIQAHSVSEALGSSTLSNVGFSVEQVKSLNLVLEKLDMKQVALVDAGSGAVLVRPKSERFSIDQPFLGPNSESDSRLLSTLDIGLTAIGDQASVNLNERVGPTNSMLRMALDLNQRKEHPKFGLEAWAKVFSKLTRVVSAGKGDFKPAFIRDLRASAQLVNQRFSRRTGGYTEYMPNSVMSLETIKAYNEALRALEMNEVGMMDAAGNGPSAYLEPGSF